MITRVTPLCRARYAAAAVFRLFTMMMSLRAMLATLRYRCYRVLAIDYAYYADFTMRMSLCRRHAYAHADMPPRLLIALC